MARPDVQRRSMVRLDDVIEISHRPVSDLELETLSNQIISRASGPGSLDTVGTILQAAGKNVDPNTPTWRALALLDKKLDYIISILQTQLLPAQQETEFQKVQANISGSGIRFPSQHLYNKGAHLWIAMIYPSAPPLRVEAVARVERIASSVKRRDGGVSVEVGAKFIAINQQDSEEILRYIFQKQREMLRARNRDD